MCLCQAAVPTVPRDCARRLCPLHTLAAAYNPLDVSSLLDDEGQWGPLLRS